MGKSDRPVAMILAPPSSASQGHISGIGLAVANTMASSAIPETHSFLMTPGPGREAATRMSAPFMASSIPPTTPAALEFSHMNHFSAWWPLMSSLPAWSVPLESTMTMFLMLNPAATMTREMAMFAAPAPTMATLDSESFFPTTLWALMAPAVTMVAVPCWSSCHTGMSISALRRSRISKHLGLEMSSRLIPPKEGARYFTVLMISSVSFVARQIGTASTPPRYLNSRALPSMTGRPASGPMSPRPNTLVPSDMMATMLPLLV